MSKWVDIRDLLRFEASADGTSASLIAVERHGELIALNFTVTCLSRLMLTLPKMIDAVVQQRGNHPGLRVVYPLDMLRVELAGDRTRILTLRTPDGFAISFTASAEKFAQIREIFAGGARRSGLPVRNVPSARDIPDKRSERAAAGWRSRTARRRAVVEADCCTCTGLFLADFVAKVFAGFGEG